eukprot:821523-Pleurochrysis_carterae.AAC.1
MEQSKGRLHQGAGGRRPSLRPGLAPHVTPAPHLRSSTLAAIRRVREQSMLHESHYSVPRVHAQLRAHRACAACQRLIHSGEPAFLHARRRIVP